MNRWLVLILVAGLGVLLLAWPWGEGSGSGIGRPVAPVGPAGAVEHVGAGAPPLVDGERSAAVTTVPRAGTEADSATAAEFGASSGADALENPLVVLVVQAGSRQPVAGAAVHWWIPRGRPSERRGVYERAFRSGSLELRLAEEARLELSDAGGHATFTEAPVTSVLVAEAAGSFGMLHLGPGTPLPARVELHKTFDLRARVVDEVGRPVPGARVALRERWNDWVHDHQWGAADDEGFVVLRHVAATLRDAFDLSSQAFVALAEPLDPPVEVPFAHEDPPTDVTELVMPAHGSCRVLVVDLEGRPYAKPVDVRLGPLPAGAPPDGDAAFDWDDPSPPRRERVEHGEVLFERVGLGAVLAARVSHGDSVAHTAVGPRPRTAGEEVTLVVEVGGKLPILVASVVDEERRPRPGCTIVAVLTDADNARRRSVGWADSDGQGRFELTVWPGEVAGEPRILTLGVYDEDLAELGATELVIAAHLRPGIHELGELVIPSYPLLAAGRVVDSEGSPMRGAQILLSRGEQEGPSIQWSRHPGSRVRSDAQGRFEVRGRPVEGLLGVQARLDGRESDRMTVPPGTLGLTLVLLEGGEIAGRVLLDPGVPARSMVVEARAADPDGRESGSGWGDRSRLEEEDGSFVIRGLRAGTYDVWLQDAETWGRDIAGIESVLVREGQQNRDPRLNPLDMTGSLRALLLTVLDEDSARIPWGRVYVHADGPEGTQLDEIEISNGKALLLTDSAALDVTVAAEGMLSQRLEISGDATVELRSSPRLRFVLAADSARPAPPMGLALRFQAPTGKDWPEQGLHDWASFDEFGVAHAAPGRLGELGVELHLMVQQEADSTRWIRIEEATPRRVHVRGGDTERTIEISLSADDVAAAAARLVR